MNTPDTQVLPAPPSLMAALTAGFDTVTNHIGLILFPILLDLLLWFGPQLRVNTLVKAFIDQTAAMPALPGEDMPAMLEASRETWLLIAARFNVISLLRTYPVGIPSLMSGRSPVEFPGGQPAGIELPSIGIALAVWALLSLAGLVAGTFYFTLVSQSALSGKPAWRRAVNFWPWATLQVIFLALFWVALFFGISIPFTCMLSFVLLSGANTGRLLLLLFAGLLIWLLLPLVFSAHGIFTNRRKMLHSVRDGVRLTRLTLPTTGLFLLVILVISEGVDLLWRIPPDNSWLTLVAVAGHAFITTALLAASFVYYRDADLWVRRIQRIHLA